MEPGASWSPESEARSLIKVVRLELEPFGAGAAQALHGLGAHRDNAVLVLQHAVNQQEGFFDDDQPGARKQIGPHDDVGDPGFVFERQEVKPLAVPGRCRVMTMPATRTRRPCRALGRSLARNTPRIAISSRLKAIGCRPTVNPVPA